MQHRLLLVLILLAGTVVAQPAKDSLYRFRLDAGYGYAWNFSKENASFHLSPRNSQYVLVGPVGARFEYRPGRWVGIGGELTFTHVSHRYTARNGYDDTDETIFLSLTELRIVPFLNVYLIKQPKFDFFLSFGGGYRYASFRYEVPEHLLLLPFLLELPYAVRLGGGMRLYVSERIGIYVAAGLEQGGMVGAGVTWRW